MDRYPGETLGQRLRRRGALPLDETARVLVAAMTVVKGMHDAGRVHGRLRPESVLIIERPDGRTDVRVLDVAAADPPCPPERAAKDSDATTVCHPSVDVRAFGLMLARCLGGNGGACSSGLTRFSFRRIRLAEGFRLPTRLPKGIPSLVRSMLDTTKATGGVDLADAIQALAPHAAMYSPRLRRRLPENARTFLGIVALAVGVLLASRFEAACAGEVASRTPTAAPKATAGSAQRSPSPASATEPRPAPAPVARPTAPASEAFGWKAAPATVRSAPRPGPRASVGSGPQRPRRRDRGAAGVQAACPRDDPHDPDVLHAGPTVPAPAPKTVAGHVAAEAPF